MRRPLLLGSRVAHSLMPQRLDLLDDYPGAITAPDADSNLERGHEQDHSNSGFRRLYKSTTFLSLLYWESPRSASSGENRQAGRSWKDLDRKAWKCMLNAFEIAVSPGCCLCFPFKVKLQ